VLAGGNGGCILVVQLRNSFCEYFGAAFAVPHNIIPPPPYRMYAFASAAHAPATPPGGSIPPPISSQDPGQGRFCFRFAGSLYRVRCCVRCAAGGINAGLFQQVNALRACLRWLSRWRLRRYRRLPPIPSLPSLHVEAVHISCMDAFSGCTGICVGGGRAARRRRSLCLQTSLRCFFSGCRCCRHFLLLWHSVRRMPNACRGRAVSMEGVTAGAFLPSWHCCTCAKVTTFVALFPILPSSKKRKRVLLPSSRAGRRDAAAAGDAT